MKLCLAIIAAVIGIVAARPAQPRGSIQEIVARRQVDTGALRAGGLNRPARRFNVPSTLPTTQILISEYISCPNITTYTFAAQQAVGPSVSVTCFYDTSSGDEVSCNYNGSNGVLSGGGNDSKCAAALDTAPDTGNCYQACPSRLGTLYYVSSTLNAYNSDPVVNCNYAVDQGGETSANCQYSFVDGLYVASSDGAICPAQLLSSSYCAANFLRTN